MHDVRMHKNARGEQPMGRITNHRQRPESPIRFFFPKVHVLAAIPVVPVAIVEVVAAVVIGQVAGSFPFPARVVLVQTKNVINKQKKRGGG